MTISNDGPIFGEEDLAQLRRELMQSGLDSWQAGELLSAFLVQRGYGVGRQEARGAVARLESAGCSLPCMRAELERLALVM